MLVAGFRLFDGMHKGSYVKWRVSDYSGRAKYVLVKKETNRQTKKDLKRNEAYQISY